LRASGHEARKRLRRVAKRPPKAGGFAASGYFRDREITNGAPLFCDGIRIGEDTLASSKQWLKLIVLRVVSEIAAHHDGGTPTFIVYPTYRYRDGPKNVSGSG
jgi:hypothetical protein